MAIPRLLRRALAVAALTLPLAAPAQDCPPPPTPPGADEMRAAQRDASDRGFLWRLQKDGTVSWLYGTVHLARLGWMFPGPQGARGAGRQRHRRARARPARPRHPAPHGRRGGRAARRCAARRAAATSGAPRAGRMQLTRGALRHEARVPARRAVDAGRPPARPGSRFRRRHAPGRAGTPREEVRGVAGDGGGATARDGRAQPRRGDRTGRQHARRAGQRARAADARPDRAGLGQRRPRAAGQLPRVVRVPAHPRRDGGHAAPAREPQSGAGQGHRRAAPRRPARVRRGGQPAPGRPARPAGADGAARLPGRAHRAGGAGARHPRAVEFRRAGRLRGTLSRTARRGHARGRPVAAHADRPHPFLAQPVRAGAQAARRGRRRAGRRRRRAARAFAARARPHLALGETARESAAAVPAGGRARPRRRAGVPAGRRDAHGGAGRARQRRPARLEPACAGSRARRARPAGAALGGLALAQHRLRAA